MDELTSKIIASRKSLVADMPAGNFEKPVEEGGCGVVGFAASVPVRGKHIFEPSIQMHNRGNGKGGGIAAASLNAKQLGVDEKSLKEDYIIQIALLDPSFEAQVEKEAIAANLDIKHRTEIKPKTDHRDFGLDTRPPDIVRYFVRAKKDALEKFAEANGMKNGPEREVEDEFIYRNTFTLNKNYYAGGKQKAFVLSHARNLVIFKIVGYAEQVVQYYGLDNFQAQIWIAHQRYPTKGRVWHPGGAHPFIGMNDALVHNGDFANFLSISNYLKQYNVYPMFLTDTEVSALQFDLLRRVFKYPMEYTIEALAPTTELDFAQLPEEKRKIYKAIQKTHIHGSPDGPWFFIIASSDPDENLYRLTGITDTAMLRPQVFAIQEGDVSIGLVGSEKQAIDATLHSLHAEDPRFRTVADRYWNARGGSHTDGGAFMFEVTRNNGSSKLQCKDKFGKTISAPKGEYVINGKLAPDNAVEISAAISGKDSPVVAFDAIRKSIASKNLANASWLIDKIEKLAAKDDAGLERALEILTLINDRRFDCGNIKRSALMQIVKKSIDRILDSTPAIAKKAASKYARIDWETRGDLRAPVKGEQTLVVYAWDFQPEGDDCDSQLAVKAYRKGWKHFIVYGLKGQRFHGCGFGPETKGIRFDLYGSSGDYIASGIDGMEIYIHDNAQDQLSQIMKQGKLVIYGDVGQAFMYGAKGGDVFVMGNGAGRPLINAVGKPRVVINGTCLDYLAESFMAGDPHAGGGFVVLNGVRFDDSGKVEELPSPYPGANLFSLASGGALFVRDPHNKLIADQLNGGEFAEITDKDWELILPYLQENERLFGIAIDDLLTVKGKKRAPKEVYRKVRAVKLAVLAKKTSPE